MHFFYFQMWYESIFKKYHFYEIEGSVNSEIKLKLPLMIIKISFWKIYSPFGIIIKKKLALRTENLKTYCHKLCRIFFYTVKICHCDLFNKG